jgi:hypothetical protein
LLSRLRGLLAMIAVVAALLAIAALFKRATCGCGENGLPFETIAVASIVVGVLAIAGYAAAGYLGWRASHPR